MKVRSCKSYFNKYMITATQIATTDIFTFIVHLVLKLLSRKVLFINTEDNRNCWKVRHFLRKLQISRGNSWNAKFSGYLWNTLVIVYQCFFNLHDCTFKLIFFLRLRLGRERLIKLFLKYSRFDLMWMFQDDPIKFWTRVTNNFTRKESIKNP